MNASEEQNWHALSAQDLLEYLKDLATRLGKVPRYFDIKAAAAQGDFPPFYLFPERWKTLHIALWRADLPNEAHLKAIEGMRIFAEQECEGFMPTSTQVRRKAGALRYMISFASYYQLFGTDVFRELQELLQLPLRFPSASSKDECCKALRRLSKELCGKRPKVKDLRNRQDLDYLPTPRQLTRLFGSFTKALKAAGFKIIYVKRVELIKDLIRLSKEKLDGRAPSRDDVREWSVKWDGLHIIEAYDNKFPDWDKLIEEAGLNV